MTAEFDAYLVQRLLGEFPSGLRKKDIGQFLGIPQPSLENLLVKLQRERAIEWDGNSEHWRLLKQPLPCEHGRAAEKETLASRCLLLLAGTEKFSACLALNEHLQQLIAESAPQGAAVCIELLIYQLLGCSHEQMDDSSLRNYLELILSVQSDAFSLGMRVRLAQSLSSVAYTAVRKLGDQRTQALLNIMDGCLRQHSGADDDPREVNTLLDDGLAAISALGDDDIEKQIKQFLSFLYYEKGDFRSCYAAFDAAQSHLQIMSCQYFNKLYPIYLAPAAHRIGQYAQGIGICTGAIREARRNKNKYRELWLTAILAVQFLQIGMLEQGLSLLSDIIPCADMESSPKLYLWIMRGLALYHMATGNSEASHRIMMHCMRERVQHGLGRFPYTSSWILEMLKRYDDHGLPPLPEFALDTEVERVLSTQNRHLHGMAFRIKAQRLPGKDAAGRTTLLRCSYEAFLGCGNRREAARSALLLAREYRLDGRQAEAQALKTAARSDLLATTLRPAGIIPQLTPWQGYIYALGTQDCLKRCFSAIDTIDLKISAAVYASELINAVQRELGAETATICRLLHDGTCEFIIGSNTSPDDYSFRNITEYMPALISNPVQRWVLVPSRNNIFLCIYISKINGKAVFLILESCYVAGAFVRMSPADMEALRSVMRRELNNLSRLQEQEEASEKHRIEYTISESDKIEYDDSPGLMRILEQASHAAQSDAPILILGETGVGKEVLARQLHKISGRSGMFVPVHPASTPENLFESEFFGYEKGAFTGAHKQKRGFFELADSGTFFIDELAEIPMSFQVKLLRVLQDHTFSRVGGIRYITSNFRLISATNKNLWNEVQEGRFREDLYYRVSVIPITIPPLRERQEDIPRLLNLFIHQFSTRYSRNLPPVSNELVAQCKRYPWPGNIREMKNIVERAVILNTGGPLNILLSETEQPASASHRNNCATLYDDLPTLEELSIRYMKYVLERTHGKVIGQDGAERILGVKRSTLYAKLHKYGLK